jgi:hypothetical protein
MIEIIWSLNMEFKLVRELEFPNHSCAEKSNSRTNKTGKVFGDFTLNSEL